MQTTFTIAALIASASAINLGADVSAEDAKDFLAYLATQGKSYANLKEFNIRQAAFLATEKWNSWANSQPGELAHYAQNFMSDMTDEEKQAMMGFSADIKEALGLQSDSDDEESGSDDEESGSDDEESGSDDEESGAVAEESGSDDSQDESSAVQVERRKKNKNKKNKNKKNKNKKNKDKKKKDPVVSPESDDSDDGDNTGPVSPIGPDSGNDTDDSDSNIPSSSSGMDWRTLGAVGPVKNQGSCGSCWSFAANAQLESLYQIQSGTLLNLSEQNLVDCATDGNNGCNGGFMYYVYAYYTDNKGVMETSDYPYKASQGSCQWSQSQAGPFKTKNSDVVQNWKNSDWKAQLDSAPISIALSAGNKYFQNYSSGILNTNKCTASADHAVTMVGWGVDSDSGVEYWIVKNSWSSGWGEDGYIRIATTASGNGVCSVQSLGVTVELA